jgi:hypothetical protein
MHLTSVTRYSCTEALCSVTWSVGNKTIRALGGRSPHAHARCAVMACRVGRGGRVEWGAWTVVQKQWARSTWPPRTNSLSECRSNKKCSKSISEWTACVRLMSNASFQLPVIKERSNGKVSMTLIRVWDTACVLSYHVGLSFSDITKPISHIFV